ncbi:MAG: HD domain-containing protein [Candidatus Woesearchaeota archaeon]|jgi:(p)ppGpp synthase/HD superfamily hydrolase
MTRDYDLEEKYEGLIPDAIVFAACAHSGQYRKLNFQPFIIHPLRVSEFLLKHFSHKPNITELRIAAILHDTVEDTWVELSDIEKNFGKKITLLVEQMTKPEIEDKKERHIAYINSFKNYSDDAKILKLSDIFDNILSAETNEKWKLFFELSKDTLNQATLKIPDDKFELLKKEALKIIDEKLKTYD